MPGLGKPRKHGLPDAPGPRARCTATARDRDFLASGRSQRPAGLGPREGEVTRGARTAMFLIAVGLVLGGVNVLSNYGFFPASTYVSKVVGNDWAWLTVGYLAARTGRSVAGAIRSALLALFPAVAIYYILDWPLVHRATPGIRVEPAGAVLEVVMWTVIAALTSVGLGILASLARRGGWPGLLAGAVVPAFIARTAYRTHQIHSALEPGTDPITAEVTGVIWPLAVAVTVSALAIGTLRVLGRLRRRARPTAGRQ